MDALKKNKMSFIALCAAILLVFTLVVFIMSQTLTGDDRQVFIMVDSVHEQFKDPDSVELVGGTLLESGNLVCTIRARNGFGGLDTAQYIITENGEIYANEGEFAITDCDDVFNNQDSFNVDKINKKLQSD